MSSQREISIWFFNGVQLLVNGLLVFGAGVYQYFYPPEEKVVLFHLHAGIWFGAILTIAGLAYCLRFSPRREGTGQ